MTPPHAAALVNRRDELTELELSCVNEAARQTYRRLGYTTSKASEKQRGIIFAELCEVALALRETERAELRAQFVAMRDRVAELEKEARALLAELSP